MTGRWVQAWSASPAVLIDSSQEAVSGLFDQLGILGLEGGAELSDELAEFGPVRPGEAGMERFSSGESGSVGECIPRMNLETCHLFARCFDLLRGQPARVLLDDQDLDLRTRGRDNFGQTGCRGQRAALCCRAVTSISTPVIVVEGLEKAYRVYSSAGERLKTMLGLRARYLDFKALAEVSFSIPSGEALGIVGENGAGKSTLLKIVSGTTAPSAGNVRVNGLVASILELGAGFHPEFTGRDNAVLYGALIGIEQQVIETRLDQILAFAELGEFIDHPIKSYSTGMVMRLAFAVATHVDADILVIDEALAVGDGYFQKKCVDKILEIKKTGTTVLFCSHAMYFISMFCDRVIWMNKGQIRRIGPTQEVVEEYEAHLLQREKRRLGGDGEMAKALSSTVGTRVGRITSLQALPAELQPGQELVIEVAIESVRSEERYHVGVAIDTMDGRCVLGLSTTWDEQQPLAGSQNYLVRLLLPNLPVASGTFSLSGFLLDDTGLHVHDQVVLPEALKVTPPQWTPSLLAVPHSWTVE